MKYNHEWFFSVDDVARVEAREVLTGCLKPQNSQFRDFYNAMIDIADKITKENGLYPFFLSRGVLRKTRHRYSAVWMNIRFYFPNRGIVGIVALHSRSGLNTILMMAAPASMVSGPYSESEQRGKISLVPEFFRERQQLRYQEAMLKYSDGIVFAPWLIASGNGPHSPGVRNTITKYVALACSYDSTHHDSFIGIDLPCPRLLPWLILGYVPGSIIKQATRLSCVGDLVRIEGEFPVHPRRQEDDYPLVFSASSINANFDYKQGSMGVVKNPYLLLSESWPNPISEQDLKAIASKLCSNSCDNCDLMPSPEKKKAC